MLGLFKKSAKEIRLFSPCNGTLKALEELQDEVFASKMIGDGFAVTPADGTVFSPVKGSVHSIFPTKHAIAIKTEDDLEILVHMGLNTVELGGNGFQICVSENDKVDETSKLAEIDLPYLESQGKCSDIVIIFPNLKDSQSIQIDQLQAVTQSQNIGKIL